ncbi:MAG TPA: hypothetical protein VJ796_10290 [Acidimicrobiia bacterium]|nr:hypothetical protein [Acidimicrobiia bacterium]
MPTKVTGAERARPMAMRLTDIVPTEATTIRRRSQMAAAFPAPRLPASAPTAPTTNNEPKPISGSSRTSVAKRTSIAIAPVWARLITAAPMARVRMFLWRHTQTKPSPKSALIDRRSPDLGARFKRSPTNKSELTRKVRLSKRAGKAAITPNSRAPTGGPMNWLVVSCPAKSRPLAVSSEPSSTIAGTTAIAAESNSVSAMPRVKTTA